MEAILLFESMFLFLSCLGLLGGLTFLIYLLCEEIWCTSIHAEIYTQSIWGLWAAFVTWSVAKLIKYLFLL